MQAINTSHNYILLLLKQLFEKLKEHSIFLSLELNMGDEREINDESPSNKYD
jgi:hypothetical protein